MKNEAEGTPLPAFFLPACRPRQGRRFINRRRSEASPAELRRRSMPRLYDGEGVCAIAL
ncbi:MAG: hypothetical protein LBR08_09570 [Bacteroidales bacterium]|nr:hypothetical protein [Bacteroidales bacterium]